MALQTRTFLYECLLRFGPDGLIGAHVIDIEQVYDDETGKEYPPAELPARPIDVSEIKECLSPAVANAAKKLVDKETAFAGEATKVEEALAATKQLLDEERAALARERAALVDQREQLRSFCASIVEALA